MTWVQRSRRRQATRPLQETERREEQLRDVITATDWQPSDLLTTSPLVESSCIELYAVQTLHLFICNVSMFQDFRNSSVSSSVLYE